MKKFILKYFPIKVQNLLISIYNYLQYRSRHGGVYNAYRVYFEKMDSATHDVLCAEKNKMLADFLRFSTVNSKWYSKWSAGNGLKGFPILEKHQLINNLTMIATVSEKNSVVSMTGGTTGASLKVFYTREDVQIRQALLDHFRANFGYTLGQKVAWFSGKGIVSEKNLIKGISYRDDFINKIRFFSTFHISDRNFESYWNSFCDYSPEFIVGFPSSVYDLCVMAKSRGLTYQGKIKVFFPTAETVLSIHHEIIGEILGCKLVDQYASSEGAPFILECEAGNKHIHPLSGIFEVVDENMQPAKEGEILVTSFTTHGTPLIRYRIGDRMKLADPTRKCSCGSFFPMVDYIDGRTSDYIFSPQNGRVNLGNISNCTKNIDGITCFQVIQNVPDSISVKVVGLNTFTQIQKENFVKALRLRVGDMMTINLDIVESIPREKSGKFRIVKNLL